VQSSGIRAVGGCTPGLRIEIAWKTGLNRSVIIRIGSLIGLRIGALIYARISPFPISREALGKGQGGNKESKNQRKSEFFHTILLPNVLSPIHESRDAILYKIYDLCQYFFCPRSHPEKRKKKSFPAQERLSFDPLKVYSGRQQVRQNLRLLGESKGPSRGTVPLMKSFFVSITLNSHSDAIVAGRDRSKGIWG